MNKTRQSPIGNRSAAGYTLVELLVVLTLIGLFAAATPAIIAAARPSAQLRATALQFAHTLRGARTAAIVAGSERMVVIDLGSRSYAVQPNGMAKDWPSNIAIAVQDAEQAEDNLRTIRFFADGTSSGAKVQFSLGGQKRFVINHGLTGRVSLDE